jgi:hypothetical protein
MPREITRRYEDPLDRIWMATAARLGMRVERSGEVYASWDGRGTLTLSSAEHFDADDSLAQLVLHEICHALCEGPENFGVPDWGLDNLTDADWLSELACQRLQAALADTVGLRGFFGTTTDYRAYWDTLGPDPLAPGDDPAIALARAGWDRATAAPWSDALSAALAATAAVVAATRPFASPESLFAAPAVDANRRLTTEGR